MASPTQKTIEQILQELAANLNIPNPEKVLTDARKTILSVTRINPKEMQDLINDLYNKYREAATVLTQYKNAIQTLWALRPFLTTLATMFSEITPHLRDGAGKFHLTQTEVNRIRNNQYALANHTHSGYVTTQQLQDHISNTNIHLTEYVKKLIEDTLGISDVGKATAIVNEAIGYALLNAYSDTLNINGESVEWFDEAWGFWKETEAEKITTSVNSGLLVGNVGRKYTIGEDEAFARFDYAFSEDGDESVDASKYSTGRSLTRNETKLYVIAKITGMTALSSSSPHNYMSVVLRTQEYDTEYNQQQNNLLMGYLLTSREPLENGWKVYSFDLPQTGMNTIYGLSIYVPGIYVDWTANNENGAIIYPTIEQLGCEVIINSVFIMESDILRELINNDIREVPGQVQNYFNVGFMGVVPYDMNKQIQYVKGAQKYLPISTTDGNYIRFLSEDLMTKYQYKNWKLTMVGKFKNMTIIQTHVFKNPTTDGYSGRYGMTIFYNDGSPYLTLWHGQQYIEAPYGANYTYLQSNGNNVIIDITKDYQLTLTKSGYSLNVKLKNLTTEDEYETTMSLSIYNTHPNVPAIIGILGITADIKNISIVEI